MARALICENTDGTAHKNTGNLTFLGKSDLICLVWWAGSKDTTSDR